MSTVVMLVAPFVSQAIAQVSPVLPVKVIVLLFKFISSTSKEVSVPTDVILGCAAAVVAVLGANPAIVATVSACPVSAPINPVAVTLPVEGL